MAAFEFQALTADGKTTRGVLQADTVRAARSVLRERGLTPLEVEAVTEKNATAAKSPTAFARRGGLSLAQLAMFSRQLATLVAAGLPMDESLQALAEASDEGKMRSMVTQLRARVMEGQTLAAALGEFESSFPSMFRASVAAGESSGKLGDALLKLADYTENREALSRQIWMALAYPVLLTAVAISVATGLLIYVVPQVVTVFNNLGRTLPLPTRMLIFIADFVAAWGLVAALVAVAGAFGFGAALRREEFRAAVDRFLLRVPLLGRVIRATETARATRTLATLTQSGVPLLEGLKLAAQTVNRLPLRQAFERAVGRVREGGALARALGESGELPPVAVRLIGSGEKSGRLDEMLEQAARHQTREAETLIAAGTAVLGPMVILLVGALVLFIVLAILLPIFDLNQLIK